MFDEQTKQTKETKDIECIICLESSDKSQNDDIIISPCSTICCQRLLLHYDCFSKWYKTNNSCPNCKFNFKINEPLLEQDLQLTEQIVLIIIAIPIAIAIGIIVILYGISTSKRDIIIIIKIVIIIEILKGIFYMCKNYERLFNQSLFE